MSLVRKIGGYLASFKGVSAVFVLCMLLEVAYATISPLSLKYLVDEAFTPRNMQAFIIIVALLLAGGTVSIAAGIGGDYALGRMSGELIRRLRLELFEHVQRQPLSFYEKFRTGDLVTRFGPDMNSIEQVVRFASPLLIRETLAVGLGLVLLLLLEWKLTLVMAAGSAVLMWLPRLLQRRAEADNEAYKEALERFTDTIDEMVKGHKTIKGLHQQAAFHQRAARQVRHLFATGFRLHRTSSLMERLPLSALLLLNGVMMGYGGYLIFQERLSVGDFIAFFTLFMTIGQSVSNLSYLVPGLVESGISFRRIGEVLAQEATSSAEKGKTELAEPVRELSMEQVSFGYKEGAYQLQEVNLRIAAGSYEAFVGPSGSGKSTALQLLASFYEPQQGTVAVNGHDLRAVSEDSLHRLLLIVTQETFLFHGSVRENLLLDRSAKLSVEEMVDVARQVGIHDAVLRWPQGYETEIHQGGGTMSGGERQRLALARALLRKPQVLLLDEVTSALDPATESAMNELLLRLKGQHTIISVTHRLASVVQADRIHVFDSGRIVESGTHQELLSQRGLYASLWEKQHGFQLSQDGLHAEVDADWLGQLPFFAGLEREELRSIAGLFNTESCREGERVVREGEEGDKFYIIVRGRFEIMKRLPGDLQQRVAVLDDGDYFGEIALLRGIPRTATVQAMGHGVLLSVRRADFLRLLQQQPQIGTRLEAALASRL
ncbi:ABC transporter transmembrane domain-containing protein [Paenibacillus sp. SYP-B4298]|uniref:ABC transporter transmembrane domain-containing protein n=1 Tax=Paenibacillus sp. SYP-B4298 TaxID=2996034 RepID=UPI0022DD4955|nr:ABC transporter transmembrane domain-containing protein [Paenibacillus sp. SYP-B4298]